MKLDALDHPKTLDFAARLNVSRPTAIGHLELFWHFVSKHAPQGNIGKFPDGSISRACDWQGEPEDFLKSLLKSGFLDPSDEHRYLVHDWPEHCPNWVRAQLQKLKRPFYVVDSFSSERTEERSYERTGEPSTRARVPKGSEGKGREAMPREGKGDGAPVDNSGDERGAGEDSAGQRSPPSDPQSRRNGSDDRRNGDFERINLGVEKLIREGGYTAEKPSQIAQALHVSTHQVEVAIGQLRDRGRLPVPGVAA